MPRIHIDLPEHFEFFTELPLYVGHINYGGHLDNALLLTLVSEARARLFKWLGFAEMDVAGAGIVVADAALQYRSEAFYGEVMVVSMTAHEWSRYGCDLPWLMCDKESGREVARGKTGIVFLDYATRKLVPVPPEFRAGFPAA